MKNLFSNLSFLTKEKVVNCVMYPVNFIKKKYRNCVLKPVIFEQGDRVKVINFDGLTDKQIDFLKAKEFFIVGDVVEKEDEAYLNVGYSIPFKSSRFSVYNINYDKKVLFLQFNLKIDIHGEVDVNNYFQGCDNMVDLFPKLINDRMPNTLVDFYNYSEICRIGNDYFIFNTDLKDYDFVFFGFAKKHSNIPFYIQKYLNLHKVPFLTYESYNLYDDKMYGLDIVNELGYDYIPTVQTVKLTKKITNYVEKEFGFPLIVKITNMDQGKGVHKIDDMEKLISFYKFNTQPTMIQRMIKNDGDFRIILLKNKVELVVKRQMTNPDEFRSNVALGGKAIKASVPQEVLDMCEDLSKHVECDVVGFDILMDMDSGKYYIMEINVSPHMTTFSVVTGIDMTGIIADYIVDNTK